MADESTEAETEEGGEDAATKKGGSPIPYLVVGMLGVALGIAVPFLLPDSKGEAPPKDDADPLPEYTREVPEEKAAYIPFSDDSIVVNINDERMTRFLSINFSLKVSQEDETEVDTLVKDKKTPLKSWLITHLAQYSLEDIRGPAGQNRVRREIRDHFNSFLFPEKGDKIFEVPFTEFAVQ